MTGPLPNRKQVAAEPIPSEELHPSRHALVSTGAAAAQDAEPNPAP
jgi:hypothetical protein